MPEPTGVATHTIEASVTIVARPETVFRFFADPAWFARWMGDGSAIDAQPGGTIRIHYPHGRAAVGQVLEVDPPRRVVFTFGFEGGDNSLPPESTTVEITLEPVPEGTRVTLRHRDLPE